MKLLRWEDDRVMGLTSSEVRFLVVVRHFYEETREKIQLLLSIWRSLRSYNRQHLDPFIPRLQDLVGDHLRWLSAILKKPVFYRPPEEVQSAVPSMSQKLLAWSTEFEPSWWILLRESHNAIDTYLTTEEGQALTSRYLVAFKEIRIEMRKRAQGLHLAQGKPAFLSKDLFPESRQTMRFTSTPTLFRESYETIGTVMVDGWTCCMPQNMDKATKEICGLSRVLSKAHGAPFGNLPCLGAAQRTLGFDLIFEKPSETVWQDVVSLRDFLRPHVKRKLFFSLSQREKLALAVSLAREVFFLHALQILHMDLSDRNIFVLSMKDTVIRRVIIGGLAKFHGGVAHRCMRPKDLLASIHRHPTLDNSKVAVIYDMRHEIYSFGVLLLQIGHLILRIGDGRSSTSKRKRELLLALAKKPLPYDMRSIDEEYRRIVLLCLQCLDGSDNKFGNGSELEEKDGVAMGVRFIQKVGNFHIC